jgi:fructokinase
MSVVIGIGELLWDLLPAGKELGGAPANFAYISSLLGNRAVVVSRVGNDELGREAIGRLRSLNIETANVQIDHAHATGTVDVTVDANGLPDFRIAGNAAWDFLEWNDSLRQLAVKSDIVCFGSLAQRQEPSRSTIHHFLRATRESCLRIFDVNLRQSYYDAIALRTGMALATVVKVNDEELPVVLQSCGLPTSNDDVSDAELLLEHFGMELVCVTRGQKGSLLLAKDKRSEHPGFRVQVADTIGAGDAFTATMAHFYRAGQSFEVINDAANRLASWVASQAGATPLASPEQIAQLLGMHQTSANV